MSMRILHTADLHLGQILYQQYDRTDEHLHFFKQLEKWVKEYQPDALVISGDIFDIPHPSASCWRFFTERFVALREAAPNMHIAIVAGNHDSAARLQSNSKIWTYADTTVIGTPPPSDFKDLTGWEKNYIVELPSGYLILLPWFGADRTEAAIALQQYVAEINSDNLPVVMTAHMAVQGADLTGHDDEIGRLRTIDIERLGDGYDYLALGHIHCPQTLVGNVQSDNQKYLSPVARYSGSVLHVNCDEAYPHSVSMVEIDRHKGEIDIKELRINQLRHFYNLPSNKESFGDQKEIMKFLADFLHNQSKKDEDERSCYIRLRIRYSTPLSADFNNQVYQLIEESGIDVRYNPKHLWVDMPEETESDNEGVNEEIAVEHLQQMENPLEFIYLTKERYINLNFDFLPEAFREIEDELKKMEEEEK